MLSSVDFFRQYTFSVCIVHPDLGEIGRAELKFGNGSLVHVKFEAITSIARLGEQNSYKKLVATTPNGDIFTLFDCKYTGFSVFANFVFMGEIEDKFKKIKIKYHELSEWFFQHQSLSGDLGKSIEWKNTPEHIGVSVRTAKEYLRITSDPEFNSKTSGPSITISENVLFTIEALNDSFSLDDLREKPIEFSSLLSILTAQPLSISAIHIVDCKGVHAYTYFPSFKIQGDEKQEGISWTECLVRKVVLDGKWQTVIENYYKSAYRKVAWRRLAGMQRYKGFWEYKILGYVSILDYYVSQQSKRQKPHNNLKPKLTQEDIDKVINAISAITSDDQQKLIACELEKIEQVKVKLDFSSKFNHAISATDQDVVKIIDFSVDDFMLIKRTRNKIAHGDELPLKDGDLQRIHTLVNKIALLLTYWAFIDFGLSKDDFVSALRMTHNPLSLGAQLNSMELARVTKTAKFFTVSKTEFLKISKTKGISHNVCFDELENGDFKFSEMRTKMYRDWMKDTARPPVSSHEEIFRVEQGSVNYVGEAYALCGSDSLQLHSAFFFTRNRVDE